MDPTLLSPASLVTLQGATLAVLMVVNVLGAVVGSSFDAVRKWLALGLSLILGLVGLTQIAEIKPINVVVAVLNGFIIAAAALGVNDAGTALKQRANGAPVAPLQPQNGFFSSWF